MILKSLRVFVGLCVAVAAVGLSAGVSHATPDGEWSTFENVPGLNAANTRGSAGVSTMSCASAGNCSAGGNFRDADGYHAFVVSQVDGVWQTFANVPGLVAANTDNNARVISVSCGSAGNCSAGGYFRDAVGFQEFVVSQVDGVWQTFERLPGLAVVNTGNEARVNSVSCGSAGNCSAVGSYATLAGYRAFVVSLVDGVWQTFENVPGLVAANNGNDAEVSSVSCASAGNCSAGGIYANGSNFQGFVVSQVDGVWQSFVDVPGLSAVNTGGDAEVSSVSCGSAGNCAAVGYYSNADGNQEFVVSQVDGVWQTFENVPGLLAANTGDESRVRSVSCASAGNCLAGGYYANADGNQAFLVSQVDGVWQTFEEVPGLLAANTRNEAEVRSVSCGSAGNCAAVGYYTNADGYQEFVVSQVDGVWQSFEAVPGLSAVNTGGDAEVSLVSCASAGNCSAGGYYTDADGNQVFMTSISTPLPEPTTTTDAPTTTTVPSTSVSTTVPSTSVSTTVPSTSVSSTLLVTNLPATGRGSSSTVLMSLMLILSGALVVSGLRRRIS